MAFKAAKCPNCAGDIQVSEERDSVKCMYCGSDIIVREAIKAAAGGVNIENLLILAKHAEEVNSQEEAYKYYMQILEHDPKNVDAWKGKGLSAVKQLRQHDFDYQAATQAVNLMASCIQLAIENSADRNKAKSEMIKYLEDNIASNETDYTLYYYAFSGTLLRLDENNIEGLIHQASFEINPQSALIDKVLLAAANQPHNREIILKKICTRPDFYHINASWINHDDKWEYFKKLCNGRELLMLKKYEVKTLTSVVNQDYAGYVRERNNERMRDEEFTAFMEGHDFQISSRNRLIADIKAVDRGYQAPRLSFDESKSACFIATAAYGTPIAYEVSLLREFRDTHLETNRTGKAFVRIYYCFSPPIARIIGKNYFLKVITRQILKPVILFMKHHRRGKA